MVVGKENNFALWFRQTAKRTLSWHAGRPGCHTFSYIFPTETLKSLKGAIFLLDPDRSPCRPMNLPAGKGPGDTPWGKDAHLPRCMCPHDLSS